MAREEIFNLIEHFLLHTAWEMLKWTAARAMSVCIPPQMTRKTFSEVDSCQDDLSMCLAMGDKEDKVDDSADVYKEVINAEADLGRPSQTIQMSIQAHDLQNCILMIHPVSQTLRSSVVL